MQRKLVSTIAITFAFVGIACGSDGGSSGGSAGQSAGGALGSAGATMGSAGLTGTAGSTTAGAGGNFGTAGALGSAGSSNAGSGGSFGTAGSAGTTNGGSTNGGTGGTTGGAAGSGGANAGTSGNAGSAGSAAGTKFVGNITTDNGADTAGLTYSKYWNQITPENAGKWGSVQSSASAAFNWATLDAIYDYAKKNNIIFKQHNFVWGSQQPTGTITQANVQNWISSFCARYPETKLIDVVNEPPPHTTPAYADAIGGGTNGDWKWITNTFTWARASCGNAILILNDYNNLEYGSEESHFIDIVKAIKTGGAPIDAVGAQSHDVNKLSAATLQTNLNTLNTQTGLPVYITEYDVSNADDAGQLATYKAQFPVFLNTSFVHGVTIWGWIYGKTWSQAPNSGLVKNGASRPAMTWLMQQVGKTAP